MLGRLLWAVVIILAVLWLLGGKNVVTPYLVNRSFNLSNHNNLSMLGLNCTNCYVPAEHTDEIANLQKVQEE
jgi:hypothetical protein